MTTKPVSSQLVEIIDQFLVNDSLSGYRTCSASIRLKLIQIRDHFDVSETLAKDLPLRVPEEEPGSVVLEFRDKVPFPKIEKDRFRAAVLPVLEDATTGRIIYQGFDEGGGYRNFYFSGQCPIHKRYHDGQAWKWVLKQKKDGSHAGFKCWRDNSFFKMTSISELEY